MKSITLIITSILITSLNICSQSLNLESDSILTSVFSLDEIKGIQSFVTYVDDFVVKKTKEDNVEKAYHDFFDWYYSYQTENKVTKSPIKTRYRYAFLESLDKDVFDAFWRRDSTILTVKYKGKVYKNLSNINIIDINFKGKYMEYMKKVGEVDHDSYFIDAHTKISTMGGIPRGGGLWMPEGFHNKRDFNLVKNRIWAACYILCIHDHVDIWMKKYLKEQRKRESKDYEVLKQVA